MRSRFKYIGATCVMLFSAAVGPTLASEADPIAVSRDVVTLASPASATGHAVASATSIVAVPYIWTATRGADGAIRFSGYVPTPALLQFLETRAGDAAPDSLQLAGGAPENFAGDVHAALNVLDTLTLGTVGFDGTHWYVKASGATEGMIREKLAEAPTPASEWSISVDAAPKPPAAIVGGDAASKQLLAEAAKLANSAPPIATPEPPAPVSEPPANEPLVGSDAASKQLLSSANRLASAPPKIDVAPVAEDEPVADRPLVGDDAASKQLLSSANKLANQPPTIDVTPEPSDGPVAIVGKDAASRQLLDAAQNLASSAPVVSRPETQTPIEVVGQDQASKDLLSAASNLASTAPQIALPQPVKAEPEGETASEQKPVPDVKVLYRFAAEKPSEGAVSLSGVVPADAIRRFLGVIAGDAPTDRLFIYAPAPSGFTAEATAGVRALEKLRDGQLLHEYRKWTLSGTAPDTETRDGVLASIKALPDAAQWATDIAVVPPIDLCRRHVETLAAENRIFFAAGSARLTADSRDAIDRLADYLDECPATIVDVEGHTDSDGAANMNLALSVERAEAVVNALTERGIDATRLYAVGFGETLPIAPNTTEAGKRKNRRIAFKIMPEKDNAD